MKGSHGCKKEVMGSQQKDERWLQKRFKKCPKRLKMEEKEGSEQREKLAVKNRKMRQPNKEKYGCKKWEKQGSQLG